MGQLNPYSVLFPFQVNWNDGGASEYWTGHYTTRPLMKGLVARANGAKHTAEIATSLACAKGASEGLCGRVAPYDLVQVLPVYQKSISLNRLLSITIKLGYTATLDMTSIQV